MSRFVFLFAPECERFLYPPSSPFRTERAGLLRARLRALGLLDDAEEVAPAPADRATMELFHTGSYLDELQRAAAGDLTADGFRMGLGTPDNPVFAIMYDVAAWACGATLTGADLILAGKCNVAFNPLGGFHHAFPARAAGFCYVNDVALACQRFAAAGKRTMYLDLDAHHGDGVQAAFYERRDVMTISMHESGETLFPGTGFENEIGSHAGTGFSVNIPLPAGIYDAAYVRAFRAVVEPLVDAYQPDVFVLELGMDTLAGDPLTHMRLTNQAYVPILNWLRQQRRPVLMAGGGGYHVENTVRGWARAWQILKGEADEHDFSAGMGGVFLGSSEWVGGLADAELPVADAQRQAVEPAVSRTIALVQKLVFPLHGLALP